MDKKTSLKRLLVVDPSEGFSIMLGKILGVNYSISRVPTIGQGISRLGEGEFDLALLTWEWPDASPSTQEEKAELLKAAAELSVPVPVVALRGPAHRGKHFVGGRLQ